MTGANLLRVGELCVQVAFVIGFDILGRRGLIRAQHRWVVADELHSDPLRFTELVAIIIIKFDELLLGGINLSSEVGIGKLDIGERELFAEAVKLAPHFVWAYLHRLSNHLAHRVGQDALAGQAFEYGWLEIVLPQNLIVSLYVEAPVNLKSGLRC